MTSQYGVDSFLLETMLKDVKNGIFVDIGAHDGVEHSNTYKMEKELGWEGVCIEPRRGVTDKLKETRSCNIENVAIGPKEGVMQFMELQGYTHELSGLIDYMDSRHTERIRRELVEYGGSKEIYNVPVMPLEKICEKYGYSEIDYVNLDVEGAERAILKSIDFEAIKIKSISVENNFDEADIRLFMMSKGFELVKQLCIDDIYVSIK